MSEDGFRYSYTPSEPPQDPKQHPHRGLAVFCVLAVAVAAAALLIIAGVSLYQSVLVKLPETTQEEEDKSSNAQTQTGQGREKYSMPNVNVVQTPATNTGTSQDAVLSIPQIAKKVRPSVVGVECSTDVGKATGSGIVMSADGYIITNAHVIADGTDIKVIDSGNNSLSAKVVGRDTQTDLAVLKVTSTSLIPAVFGDSDKLEDGETAVAIGNPLGMELAGSITAGIISSAKRHISLEGRDVSLIQTDASINPGNSGGPLVNEFGQVVGINSIKIGEYEGLGFAIPINFALPVVKELILNGYIKGRPLLGINGEDVSDSDVANYGIPHGVLVHDVDETSDAYQKGLQGGDIITSVNGTEIKGIADLNKVKDTTHAGDSMVLKIYRKGSYFTISVLLSEQKPETTEP